MSDRIMKTERVRDLFRFATAWDMTEREGRPDLARLSANQALAFDVWHAEVIRAAKAEALREACDEVRASSFWADGSDNYADRVRGWLSSRADRIERSDDER